MNFFLKLYVRLTRKPSNREKFIIFSSKNKSFFYLRLVLLVARESIHLMQKKDLYNKSASVTYSFLVSLIPLLALSFTAFSIFGGFDRFAQHSLIPLIKIHFAEASDKIIFYLDLFVKKMETGGTFGMVSLFLFIITVVLLLSNIQKAFDDINETKIKKNIINRGMNYFALIFLVPFIFALSGATSPQIISKLKFAEDMFNEFGVLNILINVFGFIIQTFGFFFIYIVLPDKKIPFKAAIGGAIMASIFTEIVIIVNNILVNFAMHDVEKGFLYGGAPLVAVLFFYWLRLIWLAILAGFCISSAIEKIFSTQIASQKNPTLTTIVDFTNLFNLICIEYKSGINCLTFEKIHAKLKIDETMLSIFLEWMLNKELILTTGEGNYISYFPTSISLFYEKNPQKFFTEVLFDIETFLKSQSCIKNNTFSDSPFTKEVLKLLEKNVKCI